MIEALLALVILSGIVSAVAFLRSRPPKSEENEGFSASDFHITEHNEE